MAFEMRLTGLELRNFRKFERYSIDFDGGMTVLVGPTARESHRCLTPLALPSERLPR